jgi:hypothetical protein
MLFKSLLMSFCLAGAVSGMVQQQVSRWTLAETFDMHS